MIVGHYNCAANPTDTENHLKQIKLSVKTIKSWNLDAKVIGLWVNENWKVQEVE